MTTEKRSNPWMWALMIMLLLLGTAIYFLWDRKNHKLADKRHKDSALYRQSVKIVSRLVQENESLKSALKDRKSVV